MGDSDDGDYHILHCGAMTLAMLLYFLFQSSPDILILIICGLSVMGNAVMLVLSKTLMSLDQAHTNDYMLTTGALFIL